MKPVLGIGNTKETRNIMYPGAEGFMAYGFVPYDQTDTQYYGTCPFCDKARKFYVNKTNQLWDCKVCGKAGNYQKFLEEIYQVGRINMEKSRKALKELAEDRQLPEKVFEHWNIGKFGVRYLLPYYSEEGKIVDIRSYRLGGKMRSAPGAKVGLWGMKDLKEHKEKKVYICEGEWDAIALRWLLRKIQREASCVVAVPGACVFKSEWIHLFQGKTVLALYDNDTAGEQGELVCQKRLRGVASSVNYIHWPKDFDAGYDVRDYIVGNILPDPKHATKRFLELMRMMKPYPRRKDPKESEVPPTPDSPYAETDLLDISIDELYSTIRKWLFLKNMDAVWMTLAVVLSNYLDGDPIWMFLVAPPGGTKTEILNCLQSFTEGCYFTSSLTPHSLISGATFGRADPSLIPKLNGLTLVLKDFTAILSKRDVEKDEIYGILRDAYDGKCGKEFGNGVTRRFESRFSIISGVTPSIYESAVNYQSLGERFLKFGIGENLEHHSEIDIINKAIDNVHFETGMRQELQLAVKRYLSHRIRGIREETLPTIPMSFKRKIVALAQFGARMRGSVSRDKYSPEMIMTRPSAEVGSRLGKQLAKLAISLAMVHRKTVVGDDEFRIVRKVMRDTVSQRNEDIIQKLHQEAPTIDDTLSTKQISFLTRYPQSTITRVLADMDLLKIVTKTGNSAKYEWTLSKYIRGLISQSEVYTTNGEEKIT